MIKNLFLLPVLIAGLGVILAGRVTAQTFTVAWWSVPADRHAQGCNLSFADGHVEHWRWAAPKPVTIPKIGATAIGGAADMKDFRRIQAALRPETRF